MPALLPFLLSWSPVLLLAVLAVWGRQPALQLALAGLGYTALLAWGYFATPGVVLWWAALDGILTTLPLLLVVFFGILLAQLLLASGGLSRLLTWLFGGLPDPGRRQLLITLGLANFFEGASIIAEPLIAPLLLTAGVAPAGAAALSIIGYAGLMGVEMAGIIITVLALVTGLPYRELGLATAWLSIPATLLLAAGVPWFLPPASRPWRYLPHLLGSAALVAGVALLSTRWLGVAVAGMLGGLALLLVYLGWTRSWRWPDRETWRVLGPLAVILLPLILVNLLPGLRELTQRRLSLTVQVIPQHPLTFTPFFSAYLYLGLALLVGQRLLKVTGAARRQLWREGCHKGWRALAAMALFGAMGQIIAYTGYQGDFTSDKLNNIPYLLAVGLKTYTGDYYPLFVPLLGWVGTFLTGYGVASLMLFGDLQVQAAAHLGLSATALAAGLTVGASVGSISSPFKIAIATPMCQALGQEGAILRLTIPFGMVVCLLLGLLLWLGF